MHAGFLESLIDNHADGRAPGIGNQPDIPEIAGPNGLFRGQGMVFWKGANQTPMANNLGVDARVLDRRNGQRQICLITVQLIDDVLVRGRIEADFHRWPVLQKGGDGLRDDSLPEARTLGSRSRCSRLPTHGPRRSRRGGPLPGPAEAQGRCGKPRRD